MSGTGGNAVETGGNGIAEGPTKTSGDVNTITVLEGGGIKPKFWTGEEVVWRPGYDDEGLIAFDSQGRMVHPSGAGEMSPEGELTIVREKLIVLGLHEVCVVFQEGTQEDPRLVAYPARLESGKTPFQGIFPGVAGPIEIKWERNNKGGLIAFHYPFARRHFRYNIFVGKNEAITKFSPRPDRTREWESDPQVGDATRCRLAWIRGRNGFWHALAFLDGKESENK